MDYVREFHRVASKLWAWPERLLVHQFWMGLDQKLCQACVYWGISNRLQDWFQAVINLDAGLREFHPPRGDAGNRPWGPVERAISPHATPVVTPPGGAGQQMLCCFHCNQLSHRAAKCLAPAPWGKVGAPGRQVSLI